MVAEQVWLQVCVTDSTEDLQGVDTRRPARGRELAAESTAHVP